MKPDDDANLVKADPSTCRRCATCEISCPNGIFLWRGDQIETRFPSRCIRCGHCVAVCPEGALTHASLYRDKFERVDPFDEMPVEALTGLLKSRRSCRRFKERPLASKKVDRLLEVDLGSCGRATVTRQAARDRTIVHLMYANPIRRGQAEAIEDIVPLFDREVSLRSEEEPETVYLAPSREEVPFTYEGGRVRFRVPKLELSQMVVIEIE